MAGLERFTTQSEFTEGFQRYRELVEQQKPLAEPWSEFLESLILPDSGSAEPIRNTADPGVYLSDAALFMTHLHTRFLNSAPSHLTAFGILGTFLGLAAGVGIAAGSLTAGNPDEVKEALRTLLGGASLAFITSIFGIFFSLIVLVVERYQVSRLQRHRQEWVSGLEKRLKLVTLEDVGLRQLRESEEQSRQLKIFNTDLRLALEEALEEKVAGRLGPLLEKLIEGTERLRQDQSADNTMVIERMIAEFTRSMNKQASSELGAVSAALEAAATTLRAASQAISEDLSQAGKSASADIASSLESFRSGMQRLETVSESMQVSMKAAAGEVAEALQSSTEDVSSRLLQAGQGMSAHIASSMEGFQRGMDRLDGTSASVQRILEEVNLSAERMAAVRQTIEKAHQHLQSSLQAAGELAHAVRESSSDFRAVWHGARGVVEQTAETARAMRDQQEIMQAAWQDYQRRFGDVDESLERAFRHMSEALDRYTQKTLDFGKALDEHTGKAIGQLGASAGELNETLEELTELLSTRRASA